MKSTSGTVCWILGTAYSGSSLLNLLLDGQPGSRGLGEAIHLILESGNPWCARCQTEIKRCPLKQAVCEKEFYRSIFDFYGDCRVLIDSSKWWKYCAVDHGIESGLRYQAVFLSKLPHEFAHSFVSHSREGDVRKAFLDWIQCYRSTWRAARTFPRLDPDRILSLPYHHLVTQPDRAVKELCDALEVRFSPEKQSRWWETDSHIVGGNNSIYAQTAGPGWFAANEDYLRGKYSGKYRQIFLDDHWKSNQALIRQSADLYRELAAELDPLLRRLGHPDSDAVIGKLKNYEPAL